MSKVRKIATFCIARAVFLASVPIYVIMIFLSSDPAFAFKAGAILTIMFTLVSAYAIRGHVKEFKAFDTEAQSVAPILDAIEPQARVMALVFDSGSKVVDGPAYLHFVKYHQIRKGGVSVYSFAEAPQSPIRFRARDQCGPPPTQLRSEWKPHEFRFNNDARFYDYFLVRGERGGFARRVGFKKEGVKQVAKNGNWTLYHYDR